MFSLKSRKKFLVSHRACSLENSNCLKLRTDLHTRTRELKINIERYDAELPIIVKCCEPIKLTLEYVINKLFKVSLNIINVDLVFPLCI